MNPRVLLIHPPAAKPSEPPLGTAVLLGHLRRQGVAAEAVDANLEGYLHLLDPDRVRKAAGPDPSTAVRRAITHLPRALALLRSPEGAASPARYGTAVGHLESALVAYGQERGRLSLGDYAHPRLSEYAPADLERLAAGEETTLFSDYFHTLLPRIEALRPSLVALSVHYRHQVLPAFELAGLLRRSLPGVGLVAGGGMISSWGETLRARALRFSCFDRVVLGPGETPLSDLALGKGGEGYVLEGRDGCFHPDFGFASRADYLSPVPVLPVSASRGCYWRRCLFCPEAAAPTQPFRAFPGEDFPDLLSSLSREYGARHFQFTDNAVPVPTLRALADHPLDGIGWHGFVRFEPILADPPFAAALARSGCRLLQLGLESGSPAVLERLVKGTALATASRVLHTLHEAGIASYVYVLLGTPGETQEDAEATLAFLERHADKIAFLNLALMNLPRESVMVRDPQRFGIAAADPLPDGEPLGLYRSFTPVSGWGRDDARRFLQRRLLGSPAIREIVRRTPPAFTSNHAFLFRLQPASGAR